MRSEEDEAFDDLAKKQGSWGGGFQAKRKMAADKDALFEKLEVEQPAQEPVAWTLLLTGEHHGIIGEVGEKFIGAPECYQRVNVYTTPPKREWVGLTDEEIHSLPEYSEDRIIYRLIRAAEAKLRSKNT